MVHGCSDINGDSIPEVIAQEFSGGAHCCTTWHIFSAGPTLREIPTPGGSGNQDEVFPLVDIGHDGKFELRVVDWTFAYWNTGFAYSPVVMIFYVWRDGQYVFAPELIRRPHLSPEELERMAQKLSWDDADPTSFEGVPTTFWADLLDLIGTGNADQIDVFTEIAWPHAKAGKERFLASFREQLRKSPYIADLRSLNGAALL